MCFTITQSEPNAINMPKYSMHQVEVLTTIKAHTLRVWERRYGFPNPHRTKTNIRYYTDEQLKKLIKVSILINHRYKISQIYQMTDIEINDIINDLLANYREDNKLDLQALTIAAIELNEIDFNKIIHNHIHKIGLISTIFDIVYPFLKHTGALWGSNKLIPAQEHFVINIVRHKIISGFDSLHNTNLKSPSIVLFSLEYEHHDIDLLMSAYIAKKMGWKVYYLGQNVPSENIIAIHERLQPTIMGTVISTPISKKVLKNLLTIDQSISCQLLITTNYEEMIKTKLQNAKLIDGPNTYKKILSGHFEPAYS